jgi:hypothetical protein
MGLTRARRSIVLGANQCVVRVLGDWEIRRVDHHRQRSAFINNCSVPLFLSGDYDVTNLTVMLRDSMDIGTTMTRSERRRRHHPHDSRAWWPTVAVGQRHAVSTLMDGSGVEWNSSAPT